MKNSARKVKYLLAVENDPLNDFLHPFYLGNKPRQDYSI
jgi:hypothetical protein